MMTSSDLDLGEDGDGVGDVVDEDVPPEEADLGGRSGSLQEMKNSNSIIICF
jgi:hypothetical protein